MDEKKATLVDINELWGDFLGILKEFMILVREQTHNSIAMNRLQKELGYIDVAIRTCSSNSVSDTSSFTTGMGHVKSFNTYAAFFPVFGRR